MAKLTKDSLVQSLKGKELERVTITTKERGLNKYYTVSIICDGMVYKTKNINRETVFQYLASIA